MKKRLAIALLLLVLLLAAWLYMNMNGIALAVLDTVTVYEDGSYFVRPFPVGSWTIGPFDGCLPFALCD